MAEQLKKIPTQISIVDLLITSEHHREQMIEVLQKAHVKDNINPESERLAEQIMASRVINYLSYDYIPADRTTHTHPLSILVSCRAQIVPAVLIDNGSGLNVCTLSSVKALGRGHLDIKRKTMTVRAFENSVRQTVGVIELDVVIGPYQFKINLNVVDIEASFTFLLGRLWLHSAGPFPIRPIYAAPKGKVRYRRPASHYLG